MGISTTNQDDMFRNSSRSGTVDGPLLASLLLGAWAGVKAALALADGDEMGDETESPTTQGRPLDEERHN